MTGDCLTADHSPKTADADWAVTVTLAVILNQAGPNVNQAVVAASAPDPNLANNRAGVTTQAVLGRRR